LQAAGLVALGFVLALAVLLPARELRIVADGGTKTISSRSADASAAVEDAGISLEAGDSIESTGSGEVVVRRGTEAVVAVDGDTYSLRGDAPSIGDLLSEAGITMGTDDAVLRDGEFVSTKSPVQASMLQASTEEAVATSRDGQVQLEVRRAVPYSVVENGQELHLRSSRETVATALRDSGIRLGPGDRVQPALDATMTAGLQVHVDHAERITVTLPEGQSVLYTFAATVGEAIAESGIALPADYRLDPAPDEPVTPGMAVHVVGYSHDQSLETERIPHGTLYEADASLPYGETRIVAGQDGILYRQYATTFENGVPIATEFVDEWYDPPPVDTVIYYSTAAAPPTPVYEPTEDPAPAYSGDWTSIVCSYDWDCSWALAVIQCESGGNPNAYNPAGYVGLFQIYEGYGGNLRDPATNIAAAYSLYASGGGSLWPNCP
jgi:uncharacterized protein YabE (DUF348 family)